MATYVLPGLSGSTMHSHSHSTMSGITSNSSRTLRHERSNGSLYSHTHGRSMSPTKTQDRYQPYSEHHASPLSNGTNHSKHNHHIHTANHIHESPSPLKTADHSIHSPSHSHNPSHEMHHHHHDHHEEHDPTHTHTHTHTDAHQHAYNRGHDHVDDHNHSHIHKHSHHSPAQPRSRVTNFLLPYTEGWPLLHSVMIEKDSRRIFYFMSLNFAFMLVQAFYGFITDSLGLLSDSIHMFFDCLALALGLFAAISSKWPPSTRFPYGFAKIETLSGFGNGVFLILISIEILLEAIERLAEGRETKRLNELLIVSSMGLAVNLIGMKAFGHHHHGPGHSHGGHDHGGHSHDHDHGNDKSHKHNISVSAPAHDCSSHANQNMHGIFLHVLADTMGSAAVIVSTLLIQFVGWSGWDPLASCIIAILIFLSSIPLVTTCAKQLLLAVPDDTEYQLRSTLAGVSSLRGVSSYTVPKFWMADFASGAESASVLGVMHVIAVRGADSEDVRQRTRAFLIDNGMDVVVQVDREGEGRCWCGGDTAKTPSTSNSQTSRFS